MAAVTTSDEETKHVLPFWSTRRSGLIGRAPFPDLDVLRAHEASRAQANDLAQTLSPDQELWPRSTAHAEMSAFGQAAVLMSGHADGVPRKHLRIPRVGAFLSNWP